MKKTIISLLMLLAGIAGMAQDFSVDGITYGKLDENNVEVMQPSTGQGNYSGNIVIPSKVTYYGKTYSVTSIGYQAFKGCKGLTSITIPNSVTSIGEYAFYECGGLTSVTIPNSVTSIKDGAFCGCRGLTSITIPNSVTSIRTVAFQNCSGLKEVHISDIAAWYKIAFYQADSNPLYYAKHLFLNGKEVTDLVIPNSVTSIRNYVFCGCSGLTSVTIPNSVTSIGSGAFYGCTGLTSITIPNSVTSIGTSAFKYCSGLTSVTIPNSVTSIGYDAFAGCTDLREVNFENSTVNIGNAAFQDCNNIKTVTVENEAVEIALNESYKFFDRTGASFTLKATIPDKAKSLFKIEKVQWSSSDSKVAKVDQNGKVDVISEGAANIIATASGVIPIKGVCSVVCSKKDYIYVGGIYYLPYSDGHAEVTNRALGYDTSDQMRTDYSGTINIPSSINWNGKNYNVTGINDYAFRYMRDLQGVVIPSTITNIGAGAFMHSEKLARVLFLDSDDSKLTRIRNSTFFQCSSLSTISLPKSINRIGPSAFYNCFALKKVQLSESLTTIEEHAFENCSSLQAVSMPDKLSSVGDYAFNNCTSLTSIKFSPLLEKITVYCFANCKSLPAIQLPDKVSLIGEYAFFNCASLTDITFSKELNKISRYSFASCTSLPTIKLPEKLTFIDEFAFTNCTSLASAYLPESLGSIQNYVFSNDKSLTEITFPSQLKGIGAGCFLNCSALKSVVFKTAISSMTVGDDAFEGCNGLNKVDVAHLDCFVQLNFGTEKSNPLTLAHNLYQNGQKLTKAVVPEGTKYINNYAFSGCTSVNEIVFPSTIQYVNDNILLNCTSLRVVRSRAIMAPPFIGSDDLTKMNSVFSKATLYVPAESIDDYSFDDFWSRFKSVKEDDGSTPSEPADVNGDGSMNTADVVAVYTFIEKGASSGFTKVAADVNGDDAVNTADVVAIYTAIIGGSGSKPYAKSGAYPGAETIDGSDNVLTILVESTDDQSKIPVTLYLANPTNGITAVEATLVAPVDVNKFLFDADEDDFVYDPGTRWTKGHAPMLSAGTEEHGADGFFISIADSKTRDFKETEGAIITVYFDGSELGDGDYTVKMKDAISVAVGDITYTSADVDAAFSVKDGKVTAVNSAIVEAAAAAKAIYTIDGKKLNDLQKGINIIRQPNGKTQKVIIR